MSDNSRVRVSIVGVVIVALFSALVARLWFLQMGPEQNLRVQAVVRTTRVVQTESPRGRILDRNGVVLAQDRIAWAVTIDRNLTSRTRTRVIGQLAELLGPPHTAKAIQSQYDSLRQSPLKPAIVALDVDQNRRLAILEHRENFPGVQVQQLTVREYPFHTLAAQVLGYTGDISDARLKTLKKKGYQGGDSIGRAGIEAAYEQYLRGDPERETVEIDPTGKQVGVPIAVHRGSIGRDVQLTIDARYQAAAEAALAQGIAAARTQQNIAVKDKGWATLQAPGGAAVVLNVRDGSVVAMASNPSYDPTEWVGGISGANYAALTNPAGHFPMLNRATQGLYAPGSTFKLVPSIALSQFGVLSPDQWIDDPGQVKLEGTVFHNDNGSSNGGVNLQRALTVSSDVYFYKAGDNFWHIWRNGDPARGLGLQQVAHELGFGRPSGVEVDEASGRIPDPNWKRAFADRNYQGQARADNAIWYPADNIFTAVGQGDVSVTPLQLADAYSMFANGGTLWQPRLSGAIKDPTTGKVLRTSTPKVRGRVTIDPYARAQMLAGFEGVTANSHGTASAAFAGFPLAQIPVAGKTGTAQVPGKGPTSLFASFFPADNPQYVVLAVVEEGGHGAETAAPIVRQIIEAMNNLPLTAIQAKSGND